MAKNLLKAFLVILFCSLTGILGYVSWSEKSSTTSTAGYFKETFPYDLEHPAKRIILPPELREISGIAYYGGNTLAGIEDEHGIIYIFDYLTGNIINRYRFHKDSDYEDLAVVNDAVYTLRSSGKIFRVTNLGNGNEKIEMEKEEIPSLYRADGAEALCYDETSHALLMVYKKRTRSEKQSTEPEADEAGSTKPVYAFDLATNKLLPEPVLDLDLQAYSRISGVKIESSTFKPSGIAKHPHSGHIYLISSISKQLLTVSSDGELIHLTALASHIFRQPEGICFLPNGDMLISSEGVYSSGYLLWFPINPDL